ncbi:MAG: hypothetical protein AAF171_27145 [Cyanobacteria bacterium P01_A01_bin.116]
MKVAKFIYPMFLVAVGLHGLLLFVPMGTDLEAELIEDVELSELPETPGAKNGENAIASTTPVGALPVPDPNVSGGPVSKPVSKPGPKPVAARPASATARRPAATRTAAARPAATSTPAARTSPAATASSSATNTPAARTSSQANQPPEPPNDASTGRPQLNLPDLSQSSRNETSAETTSNEGNNDGSTTATGLIASATGQLSAALKSLSSDFASDYTYSDVNTDAEGVARRRQLWAAKISQQANTAAGESVEPIVLPKAAKLSYPIETSMQAERRSFRVCLAPEPNNAEVAVLFDSQGNAAGTPEIIRSSGYPAIDNELIARVQKGGFTAADEGFPLNRLSKAYALPVEVEYVAADCMSLPKLSEDKP